MTSPLKQMMLCYGGVGREAYWRGMESEDWLLAAGQIVCCDFALPPHTQPRPPSLGVNP